jgi:hypothetical protein
VSVKATRGVGITATITGYAYETIPNKAILAGQTKGTDEENSLVQPNPISRTAPARAPASLGALALGAPGLSIWRRDETDLKSQAG